MLKELNKILESLEFEEDGFLKMVGFDHNSDLLNLNFILNIEQKIQDWNIICKEPIDYIFKYEISYDVEIMENHILLSPYQQNRFELFFNGKCSNIEKVICDLYEKHKEITNDWFDIKKFLNNEADLNNLLNGSYGKFAEGPDVIINEYESVLNKHNIKTSQLGPYNPKYWDGKYWQDVMDVYKVCIINGSYIIAKDFEAKRL